MSDRVGTAEISHFRAPYKDAMFAGMGAADPYSNEFVRSAEGYGVYHGVGEGDDDEGGGGDTSVIDEERQRERLRGMWGHSAWRNPWNGIGDATYRIGRTTPIGYGSQYVHGEGSLLPAGLHGYGRGGPMSGYGRGGPMSGYGRGGASELSFAFGATSDPTAPPMAPGEPPINVLDPYFVVDGGITFATDATSGVVNQMMTQFAPTDPAFAIPIDPFTIAIVFYHGVTQAPEGSEPGPYTPLQTLLGSLLPSAGDHVITLMDKRLVMPTPGKRQMLITRNPQLVADATKGGAGYFITKDADAVLIGQAKTIAAKGGGALQAGFLKGPWGVALVVAGVVGAIALATSGKKRRS